MPKSVVGRSPGQLVGVVKFAELLGKQRLKRFFAVYDEDTAL